MKNRKQWAFRWYVRWLVPFPLQVRILKHYFGNAVVYHDSECNIELTRYTAETHDGSTQPIRVK